MTYIMNLAFQASMYVIWRRKKLSVYNLVCRPAPSLILNVQLTLRAKLDSLSRAHRNRPTILTFLSTWLQLFSS
ncbi:hypothetical protein BRARA_D01455 [Brassica rapa]|uniref:Uncharacterized protein n=1 Tax=Brassica campestris TaxID=3711 RepID=A0A397ZSB5_BRACM|nr:hypothetical protein BRARA_D01455 [Brassica rapa]